MKQSHDFQRGVQHFIKNGENILNPSCSIVLIQMNGDSNLCFVTPSRIAVLSDTTLPSSFSSRPADAFSADAFSADAESVRFAAQLMLASGYRRSRDHS